MRGIGAAARFNSSENITMLKEFLNQQILTLEEKEGRLILELEELETASKEIPGLKLNDSDVRELRQYINGLKEKNQGSLDIVKGRLEQFKHFRKIMGQ